MKDRITGYTKTSHKLKSESRLEDVITYTCPQCSKSFVKKEGYALVTVYSSVFQFFCSVSCIHYFTKKFKEKVSR